MFQSLLFYSAEIGKDRDISSSIVTLTKHIQHVVLIRLEFSIKKFNFFQCQRGKKFRAFNTFNSSPKTFSLNLLNHCPCRLHKKNSSRRGFFSVQPRAPNDKTAKKHNYLLFFPFFEEDFSTRFEGISIFVPPGPQTSLSFSLCAEKLSPSRF